MEPSTNYEVSLQHATARTLAAVHARLAPNRVPAVGNVRSVALPRGQVAMTTHRGAYTGLRAAHDAVLAWCRAHSRTPAGPRWEVYGHWTEHAPPQTDVCYLLLPR
jgi:effector-binding domain-containing protein